MNNQIKGTLHKILEKQSGNGSKGVWVKQEFVIKTKDQYPKEVCITAFGKKCDDIPSKANGQDVTVSYYPESKEWNNRYFTTLVLDKIDY
jgi:hypothetical protein